MEKSDPKSLALHLIKEDIKYHQMVAKCSAAEVHIEFFPDLATVVKSLLGSDKTGDDWEDRYVVAMGRANEIRWGDESALDRAAEKVMEAVAEE